LGSKPFEMASRSQLRLFAANSSAMRSSSTRVCGCCGDFWGLLKAWRARCFQWALSWLMFLPRTGSSTGTVPTQATNEPACPNSERVRVSNAVFPIIQDYIASIAIECPSSASRSLRQFAECLPSGAPYTWAAHRELMCMFPGIFWTRQWLLRADSKQWMTLHWSMMCAQRSPQGYERQLEDQRLQRSIMSPPYSRWRPCVVFHQPRYALWSEMEIAMRTGILVMLRLMHLPMMRHLVTGSSGTFTMRISLDACLDLWQQYSETVYLGAPPPGIDEFPAWLPWDCAMVFQGWAWPVDDWQEMPVWEFLPPQDGVEPDFGAVVYAYEWDEDDEGRMRPYPDPGMTGETPLYLDTTGVTLSWDPATAPMTNTYQPAVLTERIATFKIEGGAYQFLRNAFIQKQAEMEVDIQSTAMVSWWELAQLLQTKSVRVDYQNPFYDANDPDGHVTMLGTHRAPADFRSRRTLQRGCYL